MTTLTAAGDLASTTGAISFGGTRGGYLACAVFVLLSAIPYVVRSHDAPISRREPFRLSPFLRSFWLSPAAYPDFAWAWLTRFLVNLGNAIGAAVGGGVIDVGLGLPAVALAGAGGGAR